MVDFYIDSLEEKIDKTITECKGLIFRGYSSTYYDSITKKIEHKEGIRLLKRKSCPGCEKCGFFFDDMQDMIATDTLLFPDRGIENGKLYTLIVSNITTDWESGHVDSWDFEIVELEEKDKRH